ncbi:MAG: hypothetical protein EOP36_01675 [Rubrivivax sp.]|nr:MAG: hypothetical protein EOP36_01675 [Rubrivivax sp.]
MHSYTYGAPTEGGKLAGVPFTLNKPIPTVVHTPASDDKPEIYSTTFTYTADSSRRYTLSVAPPTLVSADFSMSFDALGSLSEGSVKTTDQSAAILGSVAKLGLAFATLDQSKPGQKRSDVERLVGAGNAMQLTSAEKAEWERIKAELVRLRTGEKVKAEYVYTRPGERAVLRKIFKQSMVALVALAGVPEAAPPPAATPPAAGAPEGPPTAVDEGAADVANFRAMQAVVAQKFEKPGADAIKSAMANGDVATLKTMRSALVGKLQAQRAALDLDDGVDAVKSSGKTLEQVQVLKAAIKAIPDYLQLALSMAELSPTDWKRRTVAALNTDIDAAAHSVRLQLASDAKPLASLATPECMAKPQGKKDQAAELVLKPTPELAALCELKLKKTIVLGVDVEYRRRLALASELATEHAPKELKGLRDEIAALDTTISEAESALKPKAKDVKAETPYAAFYKNITTVAEEDDKKVISMVGNRRPKYVVLVRSLDAYVSPETSLADSGSSTQGGGTTGTDPTKAGDLQTPVTPVPAGPNNGK